MVDRITYRCREDKIKVSCDTFIFNFTFGKKVFNSKANLPLAIVWPERIKNNGS